MITISTLTDFISTEKKRSVIFKSPSYFNGRNINHMLHAALVLFAYDSLPNAKKKKTFKEFRLGIS